MLMSVNGDYGTFNDQCSLVILYKGCPVPYYPETGESSFFDLTNTPLKVKQGGDSW